jgi:hypothetical protein
VRRLLVWNPELEDELAGRAAARVDSARERTLRRLAARFLFLGSSEDALLAPWDLPDDFRRAWSERGVELPEIVREPPSEPRRLLAWGAAPSLAKRFAATSVACDLPSSEVVRRANSKVFAHELAARLGLERAGWICRDAREVDARLRDFAPGALWVVKRELGFGGLGHLLGRGRELPANGAGWLRGAFDEGAVVLEPWVERARDFSTQLEVARSGEVALAGICELVTRKNGGYVGNRVGAIDLDRDTRSQLEETARAVGRELAREGYFGPVGIDAFVASNDQLRPLVEVNARYTFGRVALAFERLVPEGGVASWLATRARPGLRDVGWLTDPWPQEPGESSVLIVASSRGELAEREAKLA